MVDKLLNYGRQAIADFVRDIGPITNALDVGAGEGADLRIVREINPNAEILAIEGFDLFAQRLAAARIESVSINIEREAFPFPDESMDLVLANQVLEHCKEVFWIFHNISRVLKTGGHLIIGVPNLASLHNRLLLMMGRQPTSIGNHSAHIRGYTRGDMLRLLNCGFPDGYALNGFRGGNFYPFPPFVARPLARVLPGMAVSFFLLLRKTRSYKDSFLRYPIETQLNTNFFVGGDESLWTYKSINSQKQNHP